MPSAVKPWGGGVVNRRTWEMRKQVWSPPFSTCYSFSIFLKSSKKPSMEGEKYRSGEIHFLLPLLNTLLSLQGAGMLGHSPCKRQVDIGIMRKRNCSNRVPFKDIGSSGRRRASHEEAWLGVAWISCIHLVTIW